MSTQRKPPRATAHVTDLALEITIAATPRATWRALTTDIAKWWPGSFYCGSGKGPRRFHLDARPGGLMWEDHGNGDGLLWGTVLAVVQEQRLEIQGGVTPAFGGPATWFGTFELTAVAGGTRLRFTESAFGRVSAAGTQEKTKGWHFLLDGALRAHLEGTAAPEFTG